jgi:hypothetical protein
MSRLSDAELDQLMKEDEKQAAEAVAAMAKAKHVSDLPLILAEFDVMPQNVVDVLQKPDFDRRTRRYVARQMQGLATELSYLVKRVRNPETLRLLNWERAVSLLEEEDGGLTTATVAERILSEAYFGFMAYVEWWTQKCTKDGKPADLPPSKIIGIYRNQLAIAMQELNMGTRRHLTATFWQRVRRGEAWIRTRQTADLPSTPS